MNRLLPHIYFDPDILLYDQRQVSNMLNYQVRPRIFMLSEGDELLFPNDAKIVFSFLPLQPFGKADDGGRTIVTPGYAIFNSNTGTFRCFSQNPLKPLRVFIDETDIQIEMTGNELHVTKRFSSLSELEGFITNLYFSIPIFLNIEFADPPHVEQVFGSVGDIPFRWTLKEWKMESNPTTQENQEESITQAWENIKLCFSNEQNRRIFKAFYYFHVASRLSRVGNTPWEFMSEIILNLNKVLEVLFPAKDGKDREKSYTVDPVRKGLTNLGYSDDEIEECFIPAMHLRNSVDSGHIGLSSYPPDKLQILHMYTDAAEKSFKDLLDRVIKNLKSGKFIPEQHAKTISSKGEKTLKSMAKFSDKFIRKKGIQIITNIETKS